VVRTPTRRPGRPTFDILPGRIHHGHVHPLTVAREVAADLGLDARHAVVLRETGSTVVDLAPAPVVARVWPAGRRDLDVVRRELAVTRTLPTSAPRSPLRGPWQDPTSDRAWW